MSFKGARYFSLSFALVVVLAFSPWVFAQNSESGILFSADKYTTNFETGVTKANGNVKIKIDNFNISGNEIEMNSRSSRITGRGNVKFVSDDVEIEADEMDFNSKSGLGDFKNAILRKAQSYHLEARVLSRIGDFLYRGREVKISTCLDCPESWSVTGSYAEVEVEEYAEIHHALMQIKDTPLIYFPVVVFPVKTKRQSGFLAPHVFNRNPDLGFRFRVPYYWAPRDDFDLTSNYDFSTKGGHRVSNELRYQYSDRSYVLGHFGLGRTQSLDSVPDTRFGFSFDERYQLSSRWTQRMRMEISSDSLYATHYSDEFSAGLRPFLRNEPSVTYQDGRFTGYAQMRFFKDNLIRGIGPVAGIDQLPELSLHQPFEKIWGPFFGEWESNVVSFRRKGPVADAFTGWIREGDRFGAQARIFLNSKLLSAVQYSPELRVRSDFYRFPSTESTSYPSAARARVAMSQKISSEIYRVYDVKNPNEGSLLKAVKHSIEPTLLWSFAPPESKTRNHPFFYPKNSPRFDLFDPDSPDAQRVSLGTMSEEQKLHKHHLLTFGLGTRVVGRFGETSRTYEEFFSTRLEQDFNLATYQELDGSFTPRLSSLRIYTTASYGGLVANTRFFIDYAYTGDVVVISDLSYKWSRYMVALGNTLSGTTKTVGARVKISDYGPWSFDLGGDYDLVKNKLQSEKYELAYASPSKCWYFKLTLSKAPNQENDQYNILPDFAPIFGAAISGKFL